MRSSLAILIFAMASAGLGSSAFAQVSTVILVEGNPKEKPQKKICKEIDAPTGSRIGSTRVCRTAMEWKILERGTQHALEQQELRFRMERAQQENEKNALGKIPR